MMFTTLSWFSLALVAIALSRTPPEMPTEMMCNVQQHKWNNNGDAVNHYYQLTWYQSVAKQMMRVDGIFFGNQNSSDPTLPIAPLQQISITDFSQNPPLNTYSERETLLSPFNCTIGVSGYLLPAANFLNATNAIWAGDQVWPEQGVVQGWTTFAIPDTVVTFYFTNDSSATLLGWDLQSPNLLTGVQTRYSNCIYQTPPSWFFTGSGSSLCSALSADRSKAQPRKTLFHY